MNQLPDETILAAIKQILTDPARYQLIWRRLPATVVDATDPANVSLFLDGDSEDNTVTGVSLIGGSIAGDRVLVDVVPPSGLYIVGQSPNTPHAGYRFLETVIFSTTTVITAADYAGIRGVRQRMIGGGGGGGGAATTAAGQASVAGGGGGGGYSEQFYVNPSFDITVTIGAGGSAGAAGANDGGAGGDTTGFAGTAIANGGAGGEGGAAGATTVQVIGGSGGGAVGDIAANGDDGGNACRFNGLGVGLGFGGGSVIGGIRRTSGGDSGGAGNGGRVYGSGGSGAFLQASQTQVAGGGGTRGVCIWDLYI